MLDSEVVQRPFLTDRQIRLELGGYIATLLGQSEKMSMCSRDLRADFQAMRSAENRIELSVRFDQSRYEAVVYRENPADPWILQVEFGAESPVSPVRVLFGVAMAFAASLPVEASLETEDFAAGIRERIT